MRRLRPWKWPGSRQRSLCRVVRCTRWTSSSLGRGRVTLVVMSSATVTLVVTSRATRRATRRAMRRASLGSGVGTVIVSSTSRPTAAGRMPFSTSVSSRVISSLLVRLRCRTRTKRVIPMCWRTRSRRTRRKDTLRVPVLRTTCFLPPRAEVLHRRK